MAAEQHGVISRTGDRVTITFVRRLAHPIDVVWRAITDPAIAGQWMAPMTIDGRVGGEVTIDFAAGGRTRGRVLVFDPPHTFEHQWHFAGETESVVRYELAAEHGGTMLTVTHRRLGQAYGGGYGAGWHAYLDRLLACLDHVDCQPGTPGSPP